MPWRRRVSFASLVLTGSPRVPWRRRVSFASLVLTGSPRAPWRRRVSFGTLDTLRVDTGSPVSMYRLEPYMHRFAYHLVDIDSPNRPTLK